MRIVADESVDAQIVDRLRAQGHEVTFIAELDPGIDDEEVLRISRQSGALLITADKDFGALVFRKHLVHSGVLLIRFPGLGPDEKAALVGLVFEQHSGALANRFSVLDKRALRFRPRP